MSDDRTEAERIDPHERISSDDPRYNGYRITEYWLATSIQEGSDQESAIGLDAIGAMRFNLNMGPAMAADERARLNLEEFARWAASSHQIEVRIRHFEATGRDQVILPSMESRP